MNPASILCEWRLNRLQEMGSRPPFGESTSGCRAHVVEERNYGWMLTLSVSSERSLTDGEVRDLIQRALVGAMKGIQVLSVDVQAADSLELEVSPPSTDLSGTKISTVKAGDTWWSIASKVLGSGTRSAELAEYNGKTTDDTPYPVDVLKIPPD